MNDAANWYEGNARYLAAALAWLRACLEVRASHSLDPGNLLPAVPVTIEGRSFWRDLVKGTPRPPSVAPKLLPSSSSLYADPQVVQSAQAMKRAAEEMNPPPALWILGRRLGLSEFEMNLLLLCLGMELDPGLAALCAKCQNDCNRTSPTFALAFSLFEESSWDALSPERPLRYWRLIEISQPGGQALTVSPLRADERIVNYLKGLNYLDDRLSHIVVPLDQPAASSDLPPSHREAADIILRHFKQVEGGSPTVQLLGPDTMSKQMIALDVAASVGVHLYRLPAALLPTQAGDLETLARLWQRESMLLPLLLYLDASELAGELVAAGQGSPVSRFLQRTGGPVFLDTRESWPDMSRRMVTLDIAKPTPAEQHRAWQATLNPGSEDQCAVLAGQFNLNFPDIARIAAQAKADTASVAQPLADRLWKSCLVSTRPRLDTLAHRVEPRVGWDDLILPAAELRLLREIAEQVAQRTTVYEKWGFSRKMSRGLGISALFAGDTGTGKTLAADVIATHLRLDLYRIDLSAVVSKYIGETEKNLRRLFDAAENGGSILFFDEADALFGKRSEVKDSHDRYANIEINYLLQRMEAYRGLAILATNMKSALDQAFLRRLRFVVNFPFPGVAERKSIWQRVFPSDVPRAALDYDRLARLNVAGGNIYNIALNAAFMAARSGGTVTMPMVLEASRAEFRKLERPINEMDFRWQAPQEGAVA